MISNIMKGNIHPVAALSKHLQGWGIFLSHDLSGSRRELLPEPGAGLLGQEGGLFGLQPACRPGVDG